MSSNYKTAITFARAVDDKSVERMSAMLSEDFVWLAYPRSSLPSLPSSLKKSQFLDFILGLVTVIERWNFKPEEPINFLEHDNKLVLHMPAKPRGSTGKGYEAEFIWFIDFDTEGKIVRLAEMFDSAYVRTVDADAKAASKSDESTKFNG
ncbi:hypothetical protein BC835DRAFT_1337054 [Cytidiella melzeri]|nr:hypothetical protein BC835DRAFT_1337054 [Cytidiella melzeri]